MINLAEKFMQKVADHFTHKSYTGDMASKAYDWDGVESIKVYSIDTVPYTPYTRSGSNRYGTPVELGDYLQTMRMTQDFGASWTIDKGNAKEQYNIKKGSDTLRRQHDVRLHPMMDKYIFAKWAKESGQAVVANGAITANNALQFLRQAKLLADNEAIPEENRICACDNTFAMYLESDPQFVYTDKLAQDSLVKGQVGMLAGWKIKSVPDGYLPAGIHALCCHETALLAPLKLMDFKIHLDPPGLSGNLVETRSIYDAFVLDAKAKGVIAICDSTAGVHCAAPTIANNGNITALGGTVVYYTTDGSDPRASGTRLVANAAGVVGNNGDTITAIAYNASCKAAYSNYVTVTRTA